ncbi:hypothetical protein [Microbispora sp. NPDC049125]|uniref:hypothetical protein n=1 Tax=Microbispora sp. NPDC049125 TaxID=3154929 RepID=UPI0034659BE0
MSRLDDMWMRPYTPDAPCPFCGCYSVETRYFGSIDRTGAAKNFFNGVDFNEVEPGQECLGRKCNRCGCAWPEQLNPPTNEDREE